MRLYLITSALNGFSYSGIYAVLFNLYLLRLGLGPELVGLVNAAGPLVFAACSLPAGTFGRRWGSRRMMIAGMSLVVVGFLFLPLTEFIAVGWQVGWLMVNYSLAWLGAALFFVNGPPFLMGVTSEEERSYVFSVSTALMPLTGFAGSLVAGLLPGLFATILAVSLDSPAAYRYPLLIAAVLYIPAVLALFATRERVPVRRSPGSGGESQKRGAGSVAPPLVIIILIALVVLLRTTGVSAARVFFNVYLDSGLHIPTSLIGTLLAVSQLLGVPVVLAVSFLMRSWEKGRIVVLASLGMALSLLPLALIPNLAAAGLGFMGVMALDMVLRPVFLIYHQELVASDWRSVISGATVMAFGLSNSAMAFAGGYVIAILDYRTLFLTGAVLTAAGALLFWSYFRVGRAELAKGSTEG